MVDSLQTLQYDDRGKDGVALLSYLVTHYYHSGFSVACEDTLLIFDYWLGEDEELAEQYRVTPATPRTCSSSTCPP